MRSDQLPPQSNRSLKAVVAVSWGLIYVGTTLWMFALVSKWDAGSLGTWLRLVSFGVAMGALWIVERPFFSFPRTLPCNDDELRRYAVINLAFFVASIGQWFFP